MSDTYNYCTECGDELPQQLSQFYQEKSPRRVPLCFQCMAGVLEGIIDNINDAIPSILKGDDDD